MLRMYRRAPPGDYHLRPRACTTAACASASSAAMASRIFSNRPSRKANSCGTSSPRLIFAVAPVIPHHPAAMGLSQQLRYLRRQTALPSDFIRWYRRNGLRFNALALMLRAVQRHVPQLHQPRMLAQRQSPVRNRPDSASTLSLRKSEMVRKSGAVVQRSIP